LSKSTPSNPEAPSTRLWLVDGRHLQDDLIDGLRAQLSTEEAQRTARFQRPERQRQYLLGRLLLRHAVGRTTGVPPSSISTLDRPGAAPLLILPDGVPQPGFSLSHSRHWIACAAGFDAALGLDVEVVDAERDVVALSETGFHPDEHAWLLRQTETERVDAFYRLWTLKEALFKLLSNCGEQQRTPVVVVHDGQVLSQDEAWFAARLKHPELSVTLCSTQPLREISLVQVTELA
jgi:4'-phosphopantetheinyl transferase